MPDVFQPHPVQPPTWSVYVLRLEDGYLYVGQTRQLAQRLRSHTQASSLDGTDLYIKAHGGVIRALVVAHDIPTLDEAIETEERVVANLTRAGHQVTCHVWTDLAPFTHFDDGS